MTGVGADRDRLVQLLGFIAVSTVLGGIVMAFLYAPTDRIQGHAQRIFYVHVPMAWLAYLAYAVILVGSIGYLWKKDFKWDRLARASAELGFVFTTLVLISGSIWGRPIWGAWWQWEARLTTTLILWFIYLGYFVVRSYAGEPERAARFAAVLGIIGAIDIPIIHQSVKWWRTLHPEPVVLDTSGPNLPDSMLATLLVMFAGFTLLFGYLVIRKTQVETIRDRIADLELESMLASSPSRSSEVIAPARGTISGGSEDSFNGR